MQVIADCINLRTIHERHKLFVIRSSICYDIIMNDSDPNSNGRFVRKDTQQLDDLVADPGRLTFLLEDPAGYAALLDGMNNGENAGQKEETSLACDPVALRARAIGYLLVPEVAAINNVVACNRLINVSHQSAAQLSVMTNILAEKQERAIRICNDGDIQNLLATVQMALHGLSLETELTSEDTTNLRCLFDKLEHKYEPVQLGFTAAADATLLYRAEAKRITDEALTTCTQTSRNISQHQEISSHDLSFYAQAVESLAQRNSATAESHVVSCKTQSDRALSVATAISELTADLVTDIEMILIDDDERQRLPSYISMKNKIATVRRLINETPNDVDPTGVDDLKECLAEASTALSTYKAHIRTNTRTMNTLVNNASGILKIA